jgi:hypothetical protein
MAPPAELAHATLADDQGCSDVYRAQSPIAVRRPKVYTFDLVLSHGHPAEA